MKNKSLDLALDTCFVAFVDKSGLGETVLALLTFLRENVAFESMLSLQSTRGGFHKTLASP